MNQDSTLPYINNSLRRIYSHQYENQPGDSRRGVLGGRGGEGVGQGVQYTQQSSLPEQFHPPTLDVRLVGVSFPFFLEAFYTFILNFNVFIFEPSFFSMKNVITFIYF